MLKKTMPKLMAVLVLLGLMGSASLAVIAEAAPPRPYNEQEYRFEQQRDAKRIEEHRREEYRRHHNGHYDNAPQHVGEGD